ncbi:hypothetical protein MED297_04999 [Reinekea sp. MED297]|uniref:Uncharacterized protein n=1 Tax=Reinekea blandensis MED297 TaxID=314283 RepID=A4BK78_9GAMM|nr:hypothetical protein MED297_04999 [Reinekea sp. MED297] [Reinekea blandensis MED297]
MGASNSADDEPEPVSWHLNRTGAHQRAKLSQKPTVDSKRKVSQTDGIPLVNMENFALFVFLDRKTEVYQLTARVGFDAVCGKCVKRV